MLCQFLLCNTSLILCSLLEILVDLIICKEFATKTFGVPFADGQMERESRWPSLSKASWLSYIKKQSTESILLRHERRLNKIVSRNQRKLLHYELQGIIVEVFEGRVNELQSFFLSTIQSQCKDRHKRQTDFLKQANQTTTEKPTAFIMDQIWNGRQDFEV